MLWPIWQNRPLRTLLCSKIMPIRDLLLMQKAWIKSKWMTKLKSRSDFCQEMQTLKGGLQVFPSFTMTQLGHQKLGRIMKCHLCKNFYGSSKFLSLFGLHLKENQDKSIVKNFTALLTELKNSELFQEFTSSTSIQVFLKTWSLK
jgi:hypothetical protein